MPPARLQASLARQQTGGRVGAEPPPPRPRPPMVPARLQASRARQQRRMRFRRDAPLDTGQVTDLRGSRMGGPGGVAIGGGGVGLVGLIVWLLISLLSGGGTGLGQLAPLDQQTVGQGGQSGPITSPSDLSSCRTGADANARDDCRIVGVVNSVQKFWGGVFERSNKPYTQVDTVLFSDQTSTGCGTATSQVGPFYCPQDRLVYIDLGFFEDLKSRFGVNVTP